ncbi:MAG: hypothetical protein U9N81_11925 [Bacillota bacterium]|nr:hypothetical protein [Bacillota bacterium]
MILQDFEGFQLEFIREEKHLMLPLVSSILVTQTLYDVLFQYVITQEKEQKLLAFIHQLETHIKSKSRAPFSKPIEDLVFLDDGLQELKLLNWMEIPVSIFRINPCGKNQDLSSIEDFITMLEKLMNCSALQNDNIIYVYPSNLVR